MECGPSVVGKRRPLEKVWGAKSVCAHRSRKQPQAGECLYANSGGRRAAIRHPLVQDATRCSGGRSTDGRDGLVLGTWSPEMTAVRSSSRSSSKMGGGREGRSRGGTQPRGESQAHSECLPHELGGPTLWMNRIFCVRSDGYVLDGRLERVSESPTYSSSSRDCSCSKWSHRHDL